MNLSIHHLQLGILANLQPLLFTSNSDMLKNMKVIYSTFQFENPPTQADVELIEQKHKYRYSETNKPFSCKQMMTPNRGPKDYDDHSRKYQLTKPSARLSSRQGQGRSAAQYRSNNTHTHQTFTALVISYHL